MNKQMYMEELRIKLKGYPQDLIEEIISDYEGHFEFGLKTGKSENDVIKSLGDIDSLVNEININFNQSEKEEIAVFTYSNNKNIKSKEYKMDMDEELTIDHNHKGNCHGFFSSEKYNNVNTIDISVTSSEIQLNNSSDYLSIEWNSDQEINSDSPYYPRIECIDNTIYCKMEKIASVTNFFKRNESFSIEFTICIPSNFENVLINSRSSSISGNELRVKNFTSTTNSGDLDLSNSKIENIQLSSSSGDTCLSSCHVLNTNIKSISGEIELDDFYSENIIIDSANGDCDISDLTNNNLVINCASSEISLSDISSERIKINTASGDIDGTDIECPELTIFSASGNIDIETTSQNINCNTASGDIDIEVNNDCVINTTTTSGNSTFTLNNDNNGFKASIRSVSGETNITYDDLDAQSSRNGTHVYGNQGTILNIQSASGDIEIN